MVKKILESACIRKASKYIPHSSLWISRVFIELANKNDKVCLTLDCSNKNKDGPVRFRTEADNPVSQFCYFNLQNDEQVYNQFVNKRINSENENNSHHFRIVEVVSTFAKKVVFNAANQLKELNNNDDTEASRPSETFRDGTSEIQRGKKRAATTATTESFIRNNEIFRKRAKPRYLLR